MLFFFLITTLLHTFCYSTPLQTSEFFFFSSSRSNPIFNGRKLVFSQQIILYYYKIYERNKNENAIKYHLLFIWIIALSFYSCNSLLFVFSLLLLFHNCYNCKLVINPVYRCSESSFPSFLTPSSISSFFRNEYPILIPPFITFRGFISLVSSSYDDPFGG